VTDHPSRRLASATHDVVARLDQATVPAFLPRPDDGLGAVWPGPLLVDLGVDIACQGPRALYRPSIGLGLLPDDLGALQDRLPESLTGDFGRHKLQFPADVLRALTLPADPHPHAGLSSWQSSWSHRRRPSLSRTAWILNSRPS